MVACAPVDCCCQPWSLPQGATHPLRIDWGPWLATAPSFVGISEVVECYLLDINQPPPFPAADPYEIAIVSGHDVDPPENTPGWAQIYNGTIVEVLVQAAQDIAVGRTFRLNMRVRANDCNGRKIVANDCVFIYITPC